MAEALRLARRGLWTTHPNPRVGCVIADGQNVLARGWHERTGGPHAEVVAAREAGERARGATAYVTLEPCSHHGRTPPCTQALIEAGIARVVCAIGDPDPRVDGAGFEALRAAGIQVEFGLMADQASALNAGFISRLERGRPWLRAKLATSLDGRVVGPDGTSKWITSEAARRDGHRWRARADAILTGIGTVQADDPSMTARAEGAWRQPVVVVADSQSRLAETARVLQAGSTLWQVSRHDAPAPLLSVERIEVAHQPGVGLNLVEMLQALAVRDINELHVEAGPTLTGALLAAGLVDELLVYQAPCLIGEGGGAMVCLPGVDTLGEKLGLIEFERRRVGPDWRIRFRPDSTTN